MMNNENGSALDLFHEITSELQAKNELVPKQTGIIRPPCLRSESDIQEKVHRLFHFRMYVKVPHL